jgi:guanyl-specific ribonuclease Sa
VARKSALLRTGDRVAVDGRPPSAVLRLVADAVRRATTPVAPLTRDGVVGLQSAAGNDAVQRLVSVQRNKKVAAGVAATVKANNGIAPSGYVGGRVFGNHEGALPAKGADGRALQYWEYDIYRQVDGRGRGKVRIVIDSKWNAWYTNDHYKSFTKLSY